MQLTLECECKAGRRWLLAEAEPPQAPAAPALMSK